jgi:hypothetical protein
MHDVAVREYRLYPGKGYFTTAGFVDYVLDPSDVSVVVREADEYLPYRKLKFPGDRDIVVTGHVVSYVDEGGKVSPVGEIRQFDLVERSIPGKKEFDDFFGLKSLFKYKVSVIVDRMEWTYGYINDHVAEFTALMENIRTESLLDAV